MPAVLRQGNDETAAVGKRPVGYGEIIMLRKSNSRRGVVILVVLSLLVLFVLLVVTFAIVAGQYRRTAQAYARKELLGLDPQKDLDRAFYELVRDTTFRSSSLRFHSLLRDYYGGDGFRGVLKSAAELQGVNETPPPVPVPNPPMTTNAYNFSGRQLMDLVVHTDPSSGTVVVSTDGLDLSKNHGDAIDYSGLKRVVGAYNGCVLTIVSGKGKGVSTRIVAYDFLGDSTNANRRHPYFRVVAPRTDSGELLAPSDLGGAAFVVNGRPFTGTGFGLDETNTLTAQDVTTSHPAALVPNYASLSVVPQMLDRGSINPFRQFGPPLDFPEDVKRVLRGNADEGYDTADYQNMFLATMKPDGSMIVPSFHRPELITYWLNELGAASWSDLPVTIQRRISLRPVEPFFDGSNPNYDPILAMAPADIDGDGRLDSTWDIDNDGDGIPDSIWVDLGFPVQTAADGRRYKPLFAILCTDLDGRLNLNAHGRKTFFTPSQYATVSGGDTSSVATPRGLGYGPPEILLDAAGITANLPGLLDARYGDGFPGASGYDARARFKFFEESENYFFPGIYGRSSYSSPSDLRAELAFGVNDYGQPSFEELTSAITEARADSPYELNLVDGGGVDAPFTPAELERVLRRFDYDVNQLPARLSEFITNWNSTASPNGRIVTTASFDPPVPAHGIPARLAQEASDVGISLSTLHSLADLLTIRLRKRGVTDVSGGLQKMLWTDALMGKRLDINRPLGNGRDNNGNAIVDEMGEQTNELMYADVATAAGAAGLAQLQTQFTSTPLWHVNGQDLNGDSTLDWRDGVLARQLLARHLYVMVLTLCDIDSTAVDPNLSRMIAQWAINVVDFRDADSIMTPFEYDRDPFNGWMDLDGDATTDEAGERELVWGCERPELLLTESLAYHTRRTSDTALDLDTQKTTTDATDPDSDYDQQYLPFGGTFLELYNPWFGTDTLKTPPPELYSQVTSATTSNTYYGVDLTKTAPGNTPVWRMLIVNKNDELIAPTAPDPDDLSAPLTADRAVYFVPSTLAGSVPGHGRRKYFRNPNQACCPIPPGRYAVVGGGYAVGNRWVSPISEINPNFANAQTGDVKRIELGPNMDPDVNQVEYHLGSSLGVVTPSSPAIGIAITESDLADATRVLPQAFSVSEPINGYPINGPAGEVYNAGNRMYEDGTGQPLPIGRPLDDSENTDDNFKQDVAFTNGTVRSFCRVYLQRLADPTRNFDAVGNPYRTIDSITVDLTSLNGTVLFSDDDPLNLTTVGVDFSCLQRGDTDPNVALRRLWPQEPARLLAGAQAIDPTDASFFPYALTQTLGDLNTRYRNINTATFPWLVWNNRPYISAYELLQVPRHRSWDLLRVDATDLMLASSYWLPTEMPAGASPYVGVDGAQGQYPYLVNFFYSDTDALNAHRVFDYVHVPSRFVGTEMVLNPDYFGKTTNFTPQPNLVSFGLLPPFNRISSYRDPGRVNINTITSSTVWEAITGGRGPSFATLQQSRKGPLDLATPSLTSANPFRPSGSNSHVPVTSMKQARDIDVTMLRSDLNGTQPLMESGGFGSLATDPRNSFFRGELLHRLGNMVTTRSNVYAIWITVGYFEVEPNIESGLVVYDAFHPDGLRVAQELGLDTGQVRRHRAFYIIDRTIPVAFEPGENHNVDKCVLLRRFIE